MLSSFSLKNKSTLDKNTPEVSCILNVCAIGSRLTCRLSILSITFLFSVSDTVFALGTSVSF